VAADNNNKFYREKSFKKLKDKWYKKLEKSGFEDAEKDEDHLKEWSSKFLRQKSIDRFHHKENYYRMASHFLHDNTFSSDTERTIWEYHSEGISLTNIAILLKKVKLTVSRDTIWAIVKRLRSSMYSLYGVTND
jgi:hypothetical protein